METSATNESLVRSSIFDTVDNLELDEKSIQNSPTSKKIVLWTKLTKRDELLKQHFFLSDVRLYESFLIKKSRKHHQLKNRYFILYKDRLELYEVNKIIFFLFLK